MKLSIKRTDVERMLILCAAALVVALALRGGDGAYTRYEEQLGEIPIETVAQPPAETQTAVVYYQDGEGYLVPVTSRVEKTEGIAKAALSLLVASSENDLRAARLGLMTVVPAGTTFDLDIADGQARVDLSKEALACKSAEEESLMVAAVSQTLCEFDTVEAVSFLFDGQKRSMLAYGTDVSGEFTGATVNIESLETALTTTGSSSVRLYFPSQTGRMLVPVTRTVFSTADVTTAMLELCKGPKPDSGLTAPLPKDCGLLGVSMKSGVVTVNFTREFVDAMQGENARQALNAVLYTAMQFPGVKQVKLQVEGKDYTPEQDAQATFLNDSEELAVYYPGVIEMD